MILFKCEIKIRFSWSSVMFPYSVDNTMAKPHYEIAKVKQSRTTRSGQTQAARIRRQSSITAL